MQGEVSAVRFLFELFGFLLRKILHRFSFATLFQVLRAAHTRLNTNGDGEDSLNHRLGGDGDRDSSTVRSGSLALTDLLR